MLKHFYHSTPTTRIDFQRLYLLSFFMPLLCSPQYTAVQSRRETRSTFKLHVSFGSSPAWIDGHSLVRGSNMWSKADMVKSRRKLYCTVLLWWHLLKKINGGEAAVCLLLTAQRHWRTSHTHIEESGSQISSAFCYGDIGHIYVNVSHWFIQTGA